MVSLSFDYKRDYGFVISFKAFDLVFMVVETKVIYIYYKFYFVRVINSTIFAYSGLVDSFI